MRWILTLTLIMAWPATPVLADAELFALLKQPGHVLLIRHALAPGTGDPVGFQLDDCTTQRNLSPEGRAQAQALGDALRLAGIDRARIYSSRWCRCLETAAKLDLGPVTPSPVLDSLYLRSLPEIEAGTQALRAFLLDLDGNEPVILVTHQVNIRHLVGAGLGSGAVALVRLEPDGDVRLVGTTQTRGGS